jgi:hypothetical protein
VYTSQIIMLCFADCLTVTNFILFYHKYSVLYSDSLEIKSFVVPSHLEDLQFWTDSNFMVSYGTCFHVDFTKEFLMKDLPQNMLQSIR